MILKILLTLQLVFLLGQFAFAGTFRIFENTFIVNNSRAPYSVHLDMDLRFEFMADQYSYGRPGDKGYIIFVLERESGSYSNRLVNRRLFLLAPLQKRSGQIMYRLRTDYATKYFLNEGKYRVRYFSILIFESDFQHRYNERPWYRELRIVENPQLRDKISNFVSRYGSFNYLGTIDFVSGRRVEEVALYLRENDKIPVMGPLHSDSISEKPIKFSWFVRYKNSPGVKEELFRYRMLPDTEWSEWHKRKKQEYYYISKGHHTFEVEGKYRDDDGYWRPIPPTHREINLSKSFIASATKGPSIEKSEIMYKNRYALLIGIEKFKDKRGFSPLPYTKNDIKLMKEALRKQKFSIVKSHAGRISKKTVIELLKKSTKKLKKDDILIIYISSHGFNEGKVGYLATTDCWRDTPNKCIRLDEIGKIVDNAGHHGRHILVLLDSCSSGLGITNKDSGFLEQDMVFKKGTIMFTAGLENQRAQMVAGLQSSVFTFYLSEGLKGSADMTGDGVITASELLIYVRYNVAKYTNGMQTPMMGRISGSGEMVFIKPEK